MPLKQYLLIPFNFTYIVGGTIPVDTQHIKLTFLFQALHLSSGRTYAIAVLVKLVTFVPVINSHKALTQLPPPA
jgi:hypothetical protein